MFNAITVQPLVAAERVVFYRERAAMLYAPGPYSLALGLAEIPYLLIQSIVMVGFVRFVPCIRGASGRGREGAHTTSALSIHTPLFLQVNITYWVVSFSHTAWK